MILALNSQPDALKIYAVRGNHEELFISYAYARLYPDEYTLKQRLDSEANYLNENIGGSWAAKISNNDLRRYLFYIESLPYIIHVKGVEEDAISPFNLVHADLKFSDEDLLYRIKYDLSLSPIDKNYILWTRDKSRAGNGIKIEEYTARDEFCSPTYCGHSIRGGIRPGNNHINLDVGTYDSGIICMVNHTEKTCQLITKQPSVHDEYTLLAAEINQHLSGGVKMDDDNDSNFGAADTDEEQRFYLCVCSYIIDLMNEFKLRYETYCQKHQIKPDKNMSYVDMLADIVETNQRMDQLGVERLTGSIVLEELVDIIENSFIRTASGTTMYSERVNPFLVVENLKQEPEVNAYLRMLGVILAKLYDKYYRDSEGVLSHDFDRARWAPALKGLLGLYDFKTQLPDLAQANDNSMQP